MRPSRTHRTCLVLEALESRFAPAVIPVTTADDSGSGSLRAAIASANANVDRVDTIAFDATAFRTPQTIALQSQLPNILNTVTIEGPVDANGVPLVHLDGRKVVSTGLALSGDPSNNSVIRGLMFVRFAGTALSATSKGHTIQGNYFGTDGVGSPDLGNQTGLSVGAGALIGGPAVADRNVISGNYWGLTMGANCTVRGNYIGLDPTGARAVANFTGVADGDFAPGCVYDGNVISGNTDVGLHLGRGGGHVVVNNLIGTDATGTRRVENRVGLVTSGNNAIGRPGQGNVIAGNRDIGIAGDSGGTIQGNWIGTDRAGRLSLGNKWGVELIGGARVGGDEPGAGNVIAFNDVGVRVTAGVNTIRRNAVSGNRLLGIDVVIPGDPASGVTPNDAGDRNAAQNFPVLTGVARGAGTVVVTGTLDSRPSQTYHLDFYASPQAHATGFGEGRTYLGSIENVVTDGTGRVAFVTPVFTVLGGVTPGMVVAATATAVQTGATSEFSVAVPVSDVGPSLPPRVTGVVVNGGAAQRSGVRSLQVTFDQRVTLPPNPAGAFQLRRLGDGAAVAVAAAVDNSGPGTAITLTVIGGAVDGAAGAYSLQDGRYELTISAASVVDVFGRPLDGDGDSAAGGDFVTTVHRLFGDFTGDGVVNAADIAAFRAAYGAGLAEPAQLVAFDYNGDGAVNALDLAALRTRFGIVLP